MRSVPRYTSQPQGACDLSCWAKDQGFKVALLPQLMSAGMLNVRRSSGVGAPGLSVLKPGRVRTYSSTSDFYSDSGALDPRGGYVFVYYGYFSAVGTWSGLFARTSNTSTAQGVGWQRSGATDALVVYHDGGGGASLGTLNGYLDSVPRVWVMGWDAVTKYAYLYRDGVLLASVYYNITPTYSGPGLLKIAASRDTSLTSGGCALTAFATNISPSQRLATDLYQNPWKLFGSSFSVPLAADLTPSGVQLSGIGSAISNAIAAISNVAAGVGEGEARSDKYSTLSSTAVFSASTAAVTSSSAALTVTVPGATISASSAAVASGSGGLHASGAMLGSGVAATSSIAAVTAGTSAAAIVGAGSALPSFIGAVRAENALTAANVASPSASSALAAAATLVASAQASTAATGTVTAGSSPSASIAASSAAVTQAVSALIVQCLMEVDNAASTSGQAVLSTGSSDTPGELILSELKIATITISALKFASIDAEVLNNG